MNKKFLLLFIAFLAIVGFAVGGVTLSQKKTEPCPTGCNAIVIAVDTLSAKHTKMDGYERDTMPRIEAFFADDFIFEEAYSVSPWTLPSFSSMYFSDLPNQISFSDLRSRANLFSELRKNNYTIGAILHPFNIFIMDGIYQPFQEDEKVLSLDTYTKAAEKLTDLQRKGTPYLLWLHTFEVHDPFAPEDPYNSYFQTIEGYENISFYDLRAANKNLEPDPERDAAYALRYDQGIASLDDRLGSFLEGLSQEVLDSTVIIVTSDHGEAFGEHGKVWHANSLYEEELHVPLYIRVPGVTGRKISEPVSLIDLTPTIFSFTQTDKPDAFKGDSLIPLLHGETREEKPLMFVNGKSFFMHNMDYSPGVLPPATLKEVGADGTNRPIIDMDAFGARYGSLKVISHVVRDQQIPSVDVYNLSTDPGEQSPIDIPHTELPHQLKDALLSIFWRSASSTRSQ